MEFTEGQLLALIETGEGKTLEFKRGMQRSEKLARTLAAFANTRGGILLVGVGDRGEILGAPHPSETVIELERIARELVEPPLDVEIFSARIEGKTVVTCSVPLSAARPHACDGEIVVRNGSSNRAAKGRALEELLRVGSKPRELTELELAALAWVEQRTAADVPATPTAFAEECGAGKQRARSAFMALERSGLLVGHGVGAQRAYRPGLR